MLINEAADALFGILLLQKILTTPSQQGVNYPKVAWADELIGVCG